MLTFAIAALVFGAVASCAYYFTTQLSLERATVQRRAAARATGNEAPTRVLRDSGARIPFADRLPLSREGRTKMELELERAGQPLRVNEYLALRLGSALLLILISLIGLGAANAPLLLRLVAAFAAADV